MFLANWRKDCSLVGKELRNGQTVIGSVDRVLQR